MHPTIMQSIVAEHTRDMRQTANHNHDASVARDRRLRQRRASRAAGPVHLLPAGLRLRMS